MWFGEMTIFILEKSNNRKPSNENTFTLRAPIIAACLHP